jgi:hypothetical protein
MYVCVRMYVHTVTYIRAPAIGNCAPDTPGSCKSTLYGIVIEGNWVHEFIGTQEYLKSQVQSHKMSQRMLLVVHAVVSDFVHTITIPIVLLPCDDDDSVRQPSHHGTRNAHTRTPSSILHRV